MISELNNIEIDKQTKKEIEANVLGLNDSEISYVFAKVVRYADIKSHAKIVIESKNPKWNYLFVLNIEGTNKFAHTKVVIESKDPKYNQQFARDVEGADIEKHAEVLLRSRDILCNYAFAKDIKGADVKAHQRVILESKDHDFIVKFTSIPGSLFVYNLADFKRILEDELEKQNKFVKDFNSKVKKLGEMKTLN